MRLADQQRDAGQRDIDLHAVLLLRLLQGLLSLLKGRRHLVLELVRELPGLGFLLAWQLAYLAQQLQDDALSAQVFDPKVLQGLQIPDLRQLRESLSAGLFKLFEHRC